MRRNCHVSLTAFRRCPDLTDCVDFAGPGLGAKVACDNRARFRLGGAGGKGRIRLCRDQQSAERLHIASVRSSCGCTTPYVENDKRTLKTYETGAIIAHLNSDTHVGQRAATLTVTFDQPYYAEVQLQIRALVHTDILMEPASLQFGIVEQGKASEAQVRLYRADFPNWQIHGRSPFRSESARRSGPGGAAGRPGLVRFEGPPGAHGPAGYISDHAILTTNDPAWARSPCRLKGRCGPTWSSVPPTCFWASCTPGRR